MTEDNANLLSMDNAEQIIERFGGIRPMASKIGAAVTTVQGWKKRNSIPLHRIELVLKSAQDNNIDLSDITNVPDEFRITPPTPEPTHQPLYQNAPVSQPETPITPAANEPPAATSAKKKAEQPATPTQGTNKDTHEEMKNIYQSSLHDDIIYTITQAERRAVEKSKWTTLILVGVSTLALALIFGMQSGGKPEHQRVAELKAMQEEMKALKAEISDIKEQETPQTLVNKSSISFKDKINTLKNDAKAMSKTLINGSNKDIKKQIAAIEDKIDGISDLASLTQRFGAFTATLGGQDLLEQSTDALSSALKNVDTSNDKAIERAISTAKNTNTSLNQSLEDVPKNDLKAAAMLLTMTQLRSALNRDNEPFTDDLELLQSLVGNESPELKESIEKLSPHAQGGILTSAGLSNELRSLTGEIVVASLKGEKLSIAERAKARVNSQLLAQSDNGEVLPNADAQKTLSAANIMVKEGNLGGAVALMKQLDGPAAKIAQPWINEAEATLLAQKLKTTISGVLDAKSAGIKNSGSIYHSGGKRRQIFLRPN